MAKLKAKIKEIHRLNEEITAPEVRVVGEGFESAIYTRHEAFRLADKLGVDLVEISPKVNPPVCRLIEYEKFLYELKQKQKEQERKNRDNVQELKELRFGPNTDDHDFEFKCKHGRAFIEANDKVKAVVFFRGREIMFKDKGYTILERFREQMADIADVETKPYMEGKRMFLILRPKK